MISILIICLIFLLILTTFFAYKVYKFSILILNIESQIEDSLTILEERYESIGRILEKEIFFDSIEVRQVIADIKASHNAIILIANKLTQNFEEENETKEKITKDQEKD
jgi:hypothetical protein